MIPTRRICGKKLKIQNLNNCEINHPGPLLFLYPKWFSNLSHHSLRQSLPTKSYIRLDQPLQSEENLLIVEEKVETHKLISSTTPDNDELFKNQQSPVQGMVPLKDQEKLRDSINLSSPPHLWSTQQPSGKKDINNKSEIESLWEDFYKYKHHDLKVKELKKAIMKRTYKSNKIVDWTNLAKMLANIYRETKIPIGTKIFLTDRTIFELTGSIASNMWIHNAGNGCQVHVLPKTESKSDSRLVTLEGSPRAKELTEKYFQKIQQDIEKSSYERSSILETISSGDGKLLHQDINSVRSFSTYISQLLKETPRLVWKSASPDQTQNHSIAAAFSTLFSDHKTSQYSSILALSKVLKFLSKHTELFGTINQIYTKVQELHLRLNIDCFNVLIESALKTKSIDQFSLFVSDMEKSEIVPNGRTWIILFSAVDSMIKRRELLIRMKDLGIKLDTSSIGSIARVLVDEAFPKVSDSEYEWIEFVKQMDSAFGSIWLFSTTFNRMIYYCAKYKKYDLATKVLELASSRRLRLDHSNMIHLLGLCRRKGNVKQSILILQANRPQNVQLESLIISSIFMTAWNKRFYNLCRVLWRYAASHGIISSQMQDVVQKSLIKNTIKSDSMSELWRSLAGKIIVRIDQDISKDFPLLKKKSINTNPMTYLMEYTTDDGTRSEQLSLAYKVIHQNLNDWKIFEPMSRYQLSNLLKKAYEMDCDWMIKKLTRSIDKTKLFELAIDVNLKSLPKPREEFRTQDLITKVSTQEKIFLLPKRINLTDQNNPKEQDIKFNVSTTKSKLNTSWTSLDLPLDQRKAFIQRLSDVFQKANSQIISTAL